MALDFTKLNLLNEKRLMQLIDNSPSIILNIILDIGFKEFEKYLNELPDTIKDHWLKEMKKINHND